MESVLGLSTWNSWSNCGVPYCRIKGGEGDLSGMTYQGQGQRNHPGQLWSMRQ